MLMAWTQLLPASQIPFRGGFANGGWQQRHIQLFTGKNAAVSTAE